MRYEGTQLSFDLGHGGVVEVRLHREPCNEIGLVMLGELERVAEAAHAPGVRAMVITSAVKRGFCAGADLRELHRENASRASEPVEARVREVRGFLDRIHAAFDAIDAAPITTIAAVHGVCFGGGFELALTCDLIVADKSARFCFPELRLGLIPGFGGIPRLERDVGNAVIRDLLLTGRSLGAARAQEIGLVSQLVAPGEHLSVAHRVAEQACRFDAATTKVAKAFLKPIPKERLAREKDVFCELFAGPVVAKALARFDADTSAMPYLPAKQDSA
ncbi:enoyl-CoA hydratase/isomerase family protein [Sandaracinus amylolyticus]|uniref:enoyl-CoA hydratase/isomerase family protein n=1 Tax=Sandaracinus amylolyticus TaxID=927083 RepID=UPI001F28B7C0|nr:enoyl-CoA hydratase/isomerase family protein [Sandaracinus amylolyticus]UJR81050.1 Short chain enoyl-CoA hydratase [Sandaracinus amylolyticus]